MSDEVFLTPIDIPDGSYKGTWSGHTLRYKYNGRDVQCETRLGVRGINVPVVFDVKSNRVIESSISTDKSER